MHYARSVPFGAGTRLLTSIYQDNVRNTTRSLFALVSSLFTLKLKPPESFESYKLRFDLIISRFVNWTPQIVLPEPLLLFFVIRGLPDQPFGSIKSHILATDTISLQKGLKLLQDVGQSGVNLINSTLVSGESIQPTSSNGTSNVLALTQPTPAPSPQAPTAAAKAAVREKRKTALCKLHGPCVHHGPKSLHTTCECRDPQLLRRKKKKPRQPANPAQQLSVTATNQQQPVPHQVPVQYQHPMQMMQPMYQQPMHQSYPMQQYPRHQQPYYSNMLLVTTTPYDADEEESDEDFEDMQPAESTSVTNTGFQIEGFEALLQCIESMEDSEDEQD